MLGAASRLGTGPVVPVERGKAADSAMLSVEVCYAGGPWQLFRRKLELPAGSTIRDAIAASGLDAGRPGAESGAAAVGVFASIRGMDSKLRHGDRVELYRALHASPKRRRKKNADERL